MTNVINLFDKEKIKVIEDHSCNDRSLIAFHSEQMNCYCIILFHLTDRPNELSQTSPYTSWGYYNHGVRNIQTEKELKEIIELYLKDIITNNYWWEK